MASKDLREVLTQIFMKLQKIITNGMLLKKYATEFQQENARSNQ